MHAHHRARDQDELLHSPNPASTARSTSDGAPWIRQRSFFSFEEAAEWVNELRPGAKIPITRPRLILHGKALNLRLSPRSGDCDPEGASPADASFTSDGGHRPAFTIVPLWASFSSVAARTRHSAQSGKESGSSGEMRALGPAV